MGIYSSQILNPSDIFGSSLKNWWEAAGDPIDEKGSFNIYKNPTPQYWVWRDRTKVLNPISHDVGEFPFNTLTLSDYRKVNVLNGKAVVRLDESGLDPAFGLNASDFTFLNDYTGGTIILITKNNSNASVRKTIGTAGADGWIVPINGLSISMDDKFTGTDKMIVHVQNTGSNNELQCSNGSYPTDTWLNIRVTTRTNGGNQEVQAFVDNNSVGLSSVSGHTISNPSSTLDFKGGAGGSGVQDYGEVILIDTEPTEQQLTDLNFYFKNKWGI